MDASNLENMNKRSPNDAVVNKPEKHVLGLYVRLCYLIVHCCILVHECFLFLNIYYYYD